jgi:hypothetical protein
MDRLTGCGHRYVVLRSVHTATNPSWSAFSVGEVVLAADSGPTVGVRAREPLNGKFLPDRNQTLLLSDQFFYPLAGGAFVDVAFFSVRCSFFNRFFG